MEKLIFGAAYYDEYAPTERLERDMQLMREAGINTIRIAESTWSVEEPRCGQFDFSHVMRTIEAAARHGIDVIVGTPTYAIPKWLADLDPEILGENRFLYLHFFCSCPGFEPAGQNRRKNNQDFYARLAQQAAGHRNDFLHFRAADLRGRLLCRFSQ